MKVFVKNYRQSPRKVRLVADLVRGKSVADALAVLSFLEKKAAEPMKKALLSAVANAKALGTNSDTLKITHIAIDKGIVMKRSMPRARGSASPINRRSSHIALELGAR